MKCYTLQNGVVTPGIQLWQDGPDKCFVHLRPDVWMPVHVDLLKSEDSSAVERRDGQIIIHRASTQVIANHVVEIIPEKAGYETLALVLGHVDKGLALFTDAAPAPSQPHRSVLGMNFCTRGVMGARRITHDRVGEGAVKLAHEEYTFLVAMDAGNDVKVHMLIYPTDEQSCRQIDPWVEGSVLRYDGQAVTYHPIEARPLSQRFARYR